MVGATVACAVAVEESWKR